MKVARLLERKRNLPQKTQKTVTTELQNEKKKMINEIKNKTHMGFIFWRHAQYQSLFTKNQKLAPRSHPGRTLYSFRFEE